VADLAAGFFAPWIVYAVVLGLHLVLPARKVAGYVSEPLTGGRLSYRLNGPLVLIVALLIWVALGRAGLLASDWLYTHRWPGLAGSAVLGLLFSLAVVLTVPTRGRPFLTELYLGRSENRQFVGGRVDAKMFLYLAGAVMLALNLFSFTAHHMLTFGSVFSTGVLLYCFLFFWFIVDYLVFENVHLYTYDIFAERVGFKLGWGCLTFYPYFYLIGLWATVGKPGPQISSGLLVFFVLIFVCGWALSRGANLQKFAFKTDPDRAFLGFFKPKALSDGQNALLYSGFWGVSRHVNYLGEILMATGLTLVLGYPELWVVWLYPLYYVLLLVPRERADERRCALKYGPLWVEYVKRVPRRIIPWVY
jgi:Delta14-sterol reductase